MSPDKLRALLLGPSFGKRSSMTRDKLRALRAVCDGGEVTRHEVNWLQHWEYIDKHKKVTVKGEEALAGHEEENTGD